MDQRISTWWPNTVFAGTHSEAAASFITYLIAHTSEAVVAVDAELRLAGFNAAFHREFERIYGYAVTLGDCLDQAPAHLEADCDKIATLCRRALAGETFRATEEFGNEQRLRTTYELAFAPIANSHDNVLFAGIVVRDLSNDVIVARRIEALLDAAPDAMIISRPDGLIEQANVSANRMFCYENGLVGVSLEDLVPARFRRAHAEHRARFSERPIIRSMGGANTDLWGVRADGSEFPVEISLNPLTVNDTRMVVAAIRDMTLRQNAEDRLRQLSDELEDRVAERTAALERVNRELFERIQVQQLTEAALAENMAEFRATFEQAAVGIAHVTPDGRWLRVNQQLCNIVGYNEQELLGRKLDDLTSPNDPDNDDVDLAQRVLAGELPAYTLEKRYPHKSGIAVWLNLTISVARYANGTPKYFIYVVKNIDAQKQSEERLRQAGLHDPLTGLPNRALLFEYADHLFARNLRHLRESGILFIDLDRFKFINDSYGHEVGDAVLQEVARRLTKNTRQGDMSFRLGGDEFLVLLPEIESGADAAEVATHLASSLSRPYHVAQLELSLSASIGISIYPGDGEDIDTLINHADIAMYQAKELGRNNSQFYSAQLAERAKTHTKIERQIKAALVGHDFRLYYQPIIDMQTAAVISVEALLRWPHSETGPDRFVPVAEATGLIDRLGEWVICEACRQHNAWRDHGLPAIPIGVNVSAVQFRHKDFADRFEQTMHDCKVDATALQLEVTETAMMDNLDHAIEMLARLRAVGIKILLDDFGTGYSSLNYLSRLPIDKIKVDKSFIHGIESDMASRAITGAIITLGRTLNLEIVAEGIESGSVLDYLRLQGCSHAQGFHVCAPVAADVFESWYRDHRAYCH